VILVLVFLHPYSLGCTVVGGSIGASFSKSPGPATAVSLEVVQAVELPASVTLRLHDSTEVSGFLHEILTLSDEDFADAWQEARGDAGEPVAFAPGDRLTAVAGRNTVAGAFLHLDQGAIVLSRGGSSVAVPLAGSSLITPGGSLLSGDSVLSLVRHRALPSRTNLRVESGDLLLIPVEAIEEASLRGPGTVSAAGPVIGILVGAAIDIWIISALSSAGSSGGSCAVGSGGGGGLMSGI